MSTETWDLSRRNSLKPRKKSGANKKEGRGRTDRIGGEEVERGWESEGDERLVEIFGAVLQVPRIRERAPASAAVAAHKATHARNSRPSEPARPPRNQPTDARARGRDSPLDRRPHLSGGGGCRCCDEACIGTKLEVSVRRRRRGGAAGGSGGPGARVLPGDRSATTSGRDGEGDLVGWRLTGGRDLESATTTSEAAMI